MTINEKFYREIRCFHCRKLLGYEYVIAGRLAFNCPRCGELNEFTLKSIKSPEVTATIDKEFTMKGGEKING